MTKKEEKAEIRCWVCGPNCSSTHADVPWYVFPDRVARVALLRSNRIAKALRYAQEQAQKREAA